jgi:transposase
MSNEEIFPNVTIGLDLGDKVSRVCELDASGKIVKTAAVATTPGAMERYFGGRPRCRVVLEASTHSPWLSRQLKDLGHEVVVANPSEVYAKRPRKRRNDRTDAEFLARQGRADVELLHPIQHRSAEAQQDLALLRARDQLVGARTKLISHVRGAVKSLGGRIHKCSAEAFAKQAAAQVPEALCPSLTPLLEVIADLTRRIREMDKQVEQMIEAHPVVEQLQQPGGVGPLTALAYVLAVEDPARFKHSRQVGAYFGLVPKLDDSSDSSPQLHITKAGDALVRKYLVSAARYILGPFGKDCDLRRYGEAIAARGGKNARKRAAIAVARKLAVMMHRLWVTGAAYDADWLQRSRAA